MSDYPDRFDLLDYEEATINYRAELAEEIRAFYLRSRSDKRASAAYQLRQEVINENCSLAFGEQELAFLEYDEACEGSDYAHLEFREGAD